jgi:hypothetical protein
MVGDGRRRAAVDADRVLSEELGAQDTPAGAVAARRSARALGAVALAAATITQAAADRAGPQDHATAPVPVAAQRVQRPSPTPASG